MSPIRVGDAERAHATQQLEQQAAAGRLSPDELEQRRTQAAAAVYDVDLDQLFQDLPGGLPPLPVNTWETMPGGPSGVPDAPGKELAAVEDTHLAAPEDCGPTRGRALRDDERERALRRLSPLNFLIPLGYVVGGTGFAWLPWQAALAIILFTTFVITPLVVHDGARRNNRAKQIEP